MTFHQWIAKSVIHDLTPRERQLMLDAFEAGQATEREAIIELVEAYGGRTHLRRAIEFRGEV